MHLAHVITLTSWLEVSQVRSHSIHIPSMVSHVWAFVVSSCLSFSCLSLLLRFLFHCLPVLCPANQLPQWRHRRGLKPLHSRTMPRGDIQPSESGRMSAGNVNTKLNPRIRRTPAHVIFSRVVQDLSHRVRIHSVSHKTVILHIKHSMSHVLRCCILHTWALLHLPHALQSDPLLVRQPDLYWCHLHTGIHPAPIHRMCLSVLLLKCSRIQVMSPRISLKRATHFRESAGKLAAMFSHKRKSSQETLSDREGISAGRQPVL